VKQPSCYEFIVLRLITHYGPLCGADLTRYSGGLLCDKTVYKVLSRMVRKQYLAARAPQARGPGQGRGVAVRYYQLGALAPAGLDA
jgi:hypothetical protein